VARLRESLSSVMTPLILALPVGVSQGIPAFASSPSAPCRTSALAPTVGRSGAAAGTSYVTLVITNRVKGTTSSSGYCTLSGTPATQFGNVVDSGGHVLFRATGPAAAKLTFANRGATIVLKPSAVASVTIGIQTASNYPPATCHQANASRVKLVFRSGATLYFALPKEAVCTKRASTTTSGVVLGTRFP
jgi:Protein of unknown function (DUF4232)